MKKLDTFHALGCWAGSARPAIALVLLLAAGNMSSLFATNPRYIYKGTDSGNGITVDLTVEPMGSFASVTGSIYDGNPSCAATVLNGMLVSNVLNAGVSYKANGLPAVSNMTGVLTGTLGAASSTLEVDTFIFCNVAYDMVVATLTLNSIQVPFSPVNPGGAGGGGGAPVLLPLSETMFGGYSLGSTWSAEIFLTTKLQNGTFYNVQGTLTVDQYFGCPLVPNCTPHSETTVLSFSGSLKPGIQGSLIFSDPPVGSHPVFTGTISSTGTSFTSLIEGLPSLGITHLYLNAQP